ncbi:MAG: hypothetical protein OXR73_20665 [Myxococcales bacterium]|nr:hypothetical protein [Myxococcales bacterium]
MVLSRPRVLPTANLSEFVLPDAPLRQWEIGSTEAQRARVQAYILIRYAQTMTQMVADADTGSPGRGALDLWLSTHIEALRDFLMPPP